MQVHATYKDYKNVIKLVDFINNNKVFRQYTGTDNIFDNIKEIYSHYSGGGFEHLMIHLNNRHIIVYDYAYTTLEYSADTWDSITEYISGATRIVGDDEFDDGFGYEADKRGHEEGQRIATVDIDKYLLTDSETPDWGLNI